MNYSFAERMERQVIGPSSSDAVCCGVFFIERFSEEKLLKRLVVARSTGQNVSVEHFECDHFLKVYIKMTQPSPKPKDNAGSLN